MGIYDRPGVRLRLKVRLLKAEVIETLLYGCMTWSPNKPDYAYDGFTTPYRDRDTALRLHDVEPEQA